MAECFLLCIAVASTQLSLPSLDIFQPKAFHVFHTLRFKFLDRYAEQSDRQLKTLDKSEPQKRSSFASAGQ